MSYYVLEIYFYINVPTLQILPIWQKCRPHWLSFILHEQLVQVDRLWHSISSVLEQFQLCRGINWRVRTSENVFIFRKSCIPVMRNWSILHHKHIRKHVHNSDLSAATWLLVLLIGWQCRIAHYVLVFFNFGYMTSNQNSALWCLPIQTKKSAAASFSLFSQ